jgi:DNA topoisomerase-1
MLREAYALLLANAAGVKETLTGALDRQHFVGPCPKCGGALRMARSPRGSRWVQCANNPATCSVTYALPAAGFIEPAPEFLCATCKTPRVKIVFRGQRPDLYCINPECPEHHKAFRIGTCPNCSNPLQIRYSFRGNRFVGCTGYPECRTTYPLPQRGKLEKDQPPCPVCRAPVVTAIEAGRPPWTLCINPECPSRLQKKAEAEAKKAEKAKVAKAKAAKKASARRKKAPSKSTPTPAEPAAPAAVEEAPVVKKSSRSRAPRKVETVPSGGPTPPAAPPTAAQP